MLRVSKLIPTKISVYYIHKTFIYYFNVIISHIFIVRLIDLFIVPGTLLRAPTHSPRSQMDCPQSNNIDNSALTPGNTVFINSQQV